MKWRRAGKVEKLILEFAMKTKIITGRSDIVNRKTINSKNECTSYGPCLREHMQSRLRLVLLR